jgi:hypothetical protein
MNPFVANLRRAGVLFVTVLARGWEGVKQLFSSKAEVARRASGRLDLLQRKQKEAERIDRLTNPRNYQGR